MRARAVAPVALLALLAVLPAAGLVPAAVPDAAPALRPYELPDPACAVLASAWSARLAAAAPGDVLPLRAEPSDEALAAMGLPPREALAGRSFPSPAMLLADGAAIPVRLASGPLVPPFAGAGCFGIRPGALLLNLNGGVGFCTLGHVFGAPGSYHVATAGHCVRPGDVVTVVAALGDRNGTAGPVLLDFGRVARGAGFGCADCVGEDWALIEVFPEHQPLVSPTACAIAGPRGAHAERGTFASVAVRFPPSRPPEVEVAHDPDPAHARAVLHVGHGSVVGTGGAPRVGAGLAWDATWFSFMGAVAQGDSGGPAHVESGAAAGLVTHVVVGPVGRGGLATALGTRATVIPAALANGQLVAYPVPLPGAP